MKPNIVAAPISIIVGKDGVFIQHGFERKLHHIFGN